MKNFSNYTDFDRKEDLHFESKVVHGALGTEPLTGAVSMPIFQAATFRHPALGESTGFAYSRLENPTRQELERTMAILEGGIRGFAFSSGQAANMAVFSLLNPGEHVILSDDIYGGTFRIIGDVFGKYGITHTYVDMSDLDEIKAAIRPNTKMLFVETPTNPMMKVADIRAVADLAKEIGALTVVDNTFLTPYFQKPLQLGADIVTHSSTKYLGGHNDTISGIVVVKESEELSQKIHMHIKSHGSQLAPLDSWLILRGIKTLAVRMDRHNENAQKLAAWLKTQPKVKKIYYVGFPEHKDYAVTKKQTMGFGGMISFTVDSFETVENILRKVDLIMFAESLGGTETLITYPTTQTHEDTPLAVKESLGITDCFLRMSVGIENVEDIIVDLDRALNG
ncbi:MAG: PLP-dependent aspartate aminotransferase family protein [Clostridiales bacterium]|nr:PLP-dependent aspartate aminotransferase family protein [Clostridiales bacterium]